MNRDQWAVFHRLNHGWPCVSLLADFTAARESIVQSMHGCSGIDLPSGTRPDWLETRRDGLAGTDSIGGADVVRVTWREIRAWVDTQPPAVIEEAHALRREWGAICHERARYWTPGNQLGPSWHDKNVYGPKTWQAQLAIDCDRWEAWHSAYEDALCCSLAPSDEPMDLLELLAASA